MTLRWLINQAQSNFSSLDPLVGSFHLYFHPYHICHCFPCHRLYLCHYWTLLTSMTILSKIYLYHWFGEGRRKCFDTHMMRRYIINWCSFLSSLISGDCNKVCAHMIWYCERASHPRKSKNKILSLYLSNYGLAQPLNLWMMNTNRSQIECHKQANCSPCIVVQISDYLRISHVLFMH